MHDHRKALPDVVEAINGALPWPTTYAEARAEVAFWRRRDGDMNLAITVQSAACPADYMLDMPAIWRMWMVGELADYGLQLHSLPEITERMRAYRSSEGGSDTLDIEDARSCATLRLLAARTFRPLDDGLVSREALLPKHGAAFDAMEGILVQPFQSVLGPTPPHASAGSRALRADRERIFNLGGP